MAKPKPQHLSYSLKMIELEKMNVLKQTDERIASLQKQAKNLISLSRLQFVCWRYCCTLVLPSSTNVLASVISKNFCTLCCIVYPAPYLSIHPLFLILFSHETTQCDEDYIITLGDLVDQQHV